MNLVERLREAPLPDMAYSEQCELVEEAADRIEALEAALKEAIEWDWITIPEDISDEVVDQINAALNKGKDQ